ncbi:nuclear transport factor 2 family protein [Arcobacter sp. CECT 8985]|uniref:nuclear transport factor 2 family protein n=1 Tax=Arcobacter sp. CECT 8985 TaxID=1935424 RepID=UPI00100A2EC4|nr:nuclear transport factor 2 family protein [Arcobacter sp. CECT 8985]RXJ86087.1 hypothetical protein CRU93_10060 [Arcobacter sp. CECT 8985]
MNIETYTKNYCCFFENNNKNTPYDNYRFFFDESSIFQDPFQKVIGVEKIYDVFQDMYKTLYSAKFNIKSFSTNDSQSFIEWEFVYKMKNNSKQSSFTGVSIVKFNNDAKIVSHIDYWDAASNIYEKIPLLGSILKIIRKKISLNE